MKEKFEKVHIMPLVLAVTPHPLALATPFPQQQQAVGGVIRWTTPKWNKVEYEKIRLTVDSIMMASQGVEIEDFVMKIAEALQKIIPDRNFSVALGSFAVEYKAKKKGG